MNYYSLYIQWKVDVYNGSQPLPPCTKTRGEPRNSGKYIGSDGKTNDKPVTIAPIYLHQTEPTALQKIQYAVHARRKATDKLNAMEDSQGSPIPVENTSYATTIREEWMKYKSWKEHIVWNMMKWVGNPSQLIQTQMTSMLMMLQRHATSKPTQYYICQLMANTQDPYMSKIDTAAGDKMILLNVFQHLYPIQVWPDDLLTGLWQSLARLTAYSDTGITQYGTLDM